MQRDRQDLPGAVSFIAYTRTHTAIVEYDPALTDPDAIREAFEKHPDEPLCAMMMDMDGLKGINDEHGHQMGAFCIRSVGKIVSGIMSEANGFACRFGGDEFIAYLRDTEIERAEEVAEAVRAEIEGHEFRREEVVVDPTISIGVAARTPEVNTAEQLLRLADDALYRAKRAGRNRVSR